MEKDKIHRKKVMAKIPKTLAPYFQEYEFSTLDIEKDADLIIGRTLEFGGSVELKWLFKTYGSRRIKEFVRTRGYRILSKRGFNYWRTVLRIRRYKKPDWLTNKYLLWRY